MKNLRTAVVLLGLAVYLAAFYITLLPDVRDAEGEPLRRVGLLRQITLLPDDYLLSNWFGSPPQFALADRLPVLLVAGAILAWAAALGWLLLAVCRAGILPAPNSAAGGRPAPQGAGKMPALQQLTRLETLVFATAAGLATLSTWVLLAGLLGLLDRTWTFAVPAALTLLAAGWVWHRRGIANSRGLTAPGATAASDDVLPLRWLWLALPFVLAILLAAMLPPFDFDVCEYHLQAPKEFYQQGRITFLPHNVYANMTMGTEMLNLLAMTVAGDWWWGALAGKTVLAAFTPLCALALFCAGRRFYGHSAGVAAALLYVSIPWVASTSISLSASNVSSSGLVEGALACYLFLAVYAVVLYCLGGVPLLRQKQCEPGTRGCTASDEAVAHLPSTNSAHPTGLLLLAGYLAGAAVAAKYPAALLVLLPLAGWVFVGRLLRVQGSGFRVQQRKRASAEVLNPEPRTLNPVLAGVPAAAKRVAAFLLAAALGCGLWFGKNWCSTGNPTYPLLYSVFDGKTWNAEKDARWNRVHRPHDFSAATLGNGLGRVALTSPWLSPLVIPLAALALMGLRRRDSRPLAVSQRLAWQLLAYTAFVIAVWWLFTHRIDRFWIPVLPVLALLGARGMLERRALVAVVSARAVVGLPGRQLPGGCGGARQCLVRPAGETPQRLERSLAPVVQRPCRR